jgi:hypothetical protein
MSSLSSCGTAHGPFGRTLLDHRRSGVEVLTDEGDMDSADWTSSHLRYAAKADVSRICPASDRETLRDIGQR